MFPSFRLPGHFSISLESLLLACGVLAALAAAERLASKLRLRPDHIWNAAALAGVSLVAGERFILFAQSWHDFLAHPRWMLSLLSIRDPRLSYAGAALALLASTSYLLYQRVPLLRAADATSPAVALLLAFVHAGYFAAGAEPGRLCSARWGLVSTNRIAYAIYGTPLHVPLIPVAAYLSLGYALIALTSAALAARGRAVAGAVLLGAGLLTVLLGQLALHWSGEPMVLGVFTWAQTAGVLSTLSGAMLLLLRR